MIAFIKRLFCPHKYVWARNIYGDEINAAGGRRSWWRCEKCGKYVASGALIDEGSVPENARIKVVDHAERSRQ